MTSESLRWDDVRIYLAVHRNGSLAAAARALGIDQTTVSRRLQAFEDSLDARLFDRTPEGLSLTPAGESILEAAEGVEANMHALERRIAGADARVEGTVRIAISEAFAVGFLAPRLELLYRRHPSIVVELASSQQFVTLSRREADIAIRQRPAGLPPAQENVVCRKLFDMSWHLYASESYLATHPAHDLDDLTGHDLLDYDHEAPQLPGFDWLHARRARATVKLRATTIVTVASLCRAGLGLALLPEIFGGGTPALVAVTPSVATATGWLLVHADLQHVARVRVVIDSLVELARDYCS
jgi:DNA-binding transcriptional LysR family regulator